MNDNENKKVLICGANGLLGQPLCFHLAEQKYQLILCDVDEERLANLAEDLVSKGGARPMVQVMDLRDENSISGGFSKLSDIGSAPHAVINASYPRNKNYGRSLENVTLEDFSENLSWHLGGFFALSKHACLGFKEDGGGSLINIASIYGMMPPRFEIYRDTPMTMPVEYAAIKSGVLHITRYFAQFYKQWGIRANAVSPGGIRDQQPEAFVASYADFCGTKGMLDAADLFGAIEFLVSDASRFMTGQNMVVDDGFSL